ncbi:MAG: hypothetical protein ABSG34_18135, partial [Candidatus Sulfotelmatobacter sp.]
MILVKWLTMDAASFSGRKWLFAAMTQPTKATEGSTASQSSVSTASSLTISLLLFLVTLILYSPTFNSGFVNYDDPAYVTSNAHVLQGLSWSNISWAFTATVEANWHPLTW